MWILLLVTAVIPDFFKDLRNKQQMREYYASLRVIRPCHHSESLEPELHLSLSPPSPTSSSQPESTADSFFLQTNSTYHDDLVNKWFSELKNDSYDFEDSDTGELVCQEGTSSSIR